ncbi:ATP-dependent RNA helicase DEAH11, chloroplastic-like [Phalaenopsis equestris]|uniref:ATP-dependent RNA helicase DEAH11, chloroplastic-like n=1 Tax=Phalaenopsis equestris TaxID=78828 RepID=UPI0009E36869|nr:ATP-dependent RNA helicase DEAH11, chloroplastic-like [Phalaenopsis equestris]XP_020575694.1 ATP-dependent RNA helicase DEAH11, chloroplastic-like [Phalaenopsis equestris]XP_020575695.1 ATP-dependent RNA helicase DEAH11, chloroplastic-like [Phalaenopsis equestris]
MSYQRHDHRHGWPPGRVSGCRNTPSSTYHARPPGVRFHRGFEQPLSPVSSPGFTLVLLRRGGGRGLPCPKVIADLISTCPAVPVDFFVRAEGNVAAKLFFQQWCHVLEALVFFWRRRLEGFHLLTPSLISGVSVCSDRDELEERLRVLFTSHINGLLEGESVQKINSRIGEVSAEVSKVGKQLSRPQHLGFHQKLQEERKSLIEELGLLKDRLGEFRAALGCLLDHLGGKKTLGLREMGQVEIFRFDVELDWARVHHIILRECKRLSSSLPIYSYRREILRGVSSNQVVVLIGETGSGKSTQLVQFLADAGLASSGLIICTQPRKIAAMTLARRVCEETFGCYADNFVSFHATTLFSQRLKSGIIYMTDHYLLQHYMNETSLTGISYIIVDEAHERSLNTDLLLALIKKKLLERLDLRVIIMSATADASKLADFFNGCCTFHVKGRTFPVDIKYVTDVSDEDLWCQTPKHIPSNYSSYLSNVIKMVSIIHKKEKAGGILAFLTSQAEVEWACENFSDSSAVVLPLHGKLSHEDQIRVFCNYPEKRKIIFSTNVAETSLTIQGIKYVVDSGMVKESRFEPSTGMNLLRVTWTSQSSANQRSGRAGRTEPGKCYRLYSKSDFQSMTVHQEPEIRKVHLGVALLRILILGVKNVQDFEFVDAPSPEAIDKAMQNLVQLGAVVCKNHFFELTSTGSTLVKLGIEPRLGKIILESFSCGLRKEGVVLAAVMANYSSIFCRVGSDVDKHKADCLKVPFCHHEGDLFTLLSVYLEWENKGTNKNEWCWQNSINAKSMRRCHEAVLELENCLKNELNMITPSYFVWNPHKPSERDKDLKKVILFSLVENVAMYTGSDQLGYEVALTGQKLPLHPSCSLLVYGQKPSWIVFTEILSSENQYLVCATAVDRESLCTVRLLSFNIAQMEEKKMLTKIISGLGNILLRRLCGKSNHGIESIMSYIQKECMDRNFYIRADFDRREIHLFASSKNLEKVSSMFNDVLECERRLLREECIEKCLFIAVAGSFPSFALFGSGGEIKHLELDNRCLTVEIFYPRVHELNNKELILLINQNISGIANIYVFGGNGQEGPDTCKWGKVTFLKPEDAQKAITKLNRLEFHGNLLKVVPAVVAERRNLPFSAVRTKVCWPQRPSRGVALVECSAEDAEYIIKNCCPKFIGGSYVQCSASTKFPNCLFVTGIRKDASEREIYYDFLNATNGKINSVKLLRGEAIDCRSVDSYEQALVQEIAPFMPNKKHSFRVEVLKPEPKDVMVRAAINFDGSLHLEAAKALDHIQGKVLPGCLSWQKMECQDMFHSSICCTTRIYSVIKGPMESLLEMFKLQKGVTYSVDRNVNGSYRVKLSAHATKIIADVRRPLENLMKGKTLTHPGLTPSLTQLLLSRDGINLLKSLERETGTYIFYDRQNFHIKLFGSPNDVVAVEEKLVQSLQHLYDNRPLDIRLRGHNLPPNLMKEVILRFGADLQGLRLLVSGVELTLSTRRLVLSARGSMEQKQKVEEVISGLATSLSSGSLQSSPIPETMCHICLCELDEPFRLETCGHKFCQGCLVNQCEATIRSRDGFPLRCAKEDCQELLLLTDLKALLLGEKLEELFQASIAWFVASNGGDYRFCPTPDCPGIYKVAASEEAALSDGPFVCGACSVETCTWCHLEYHALISCERYREYKESPDFSLHDWRLGRENVKDCPVCRHVIEKVDGCNHVECRCGRHICWVCLEVFTASDACYSHIRSFHDI